MLTKDFNHNLTAAKMNKLSNHNTLLSYREEMRRYCVSVVNMPPLFRPLLRRGREP